MSHTRVTIVDNGPYGVKTDGRVTFCGQAVDAGEELWLCRCGGSSNAPFCDGTHRKNGFDDTVEADTKDARVWEGRTLRTRFDPNVCMHVRYCKPLNDLREAELAGDDAAAAEIARVVEQCPSGALTWEAKGDVSAPEPVHEADVVIVEGGEIRLRGDFEIGATRSEGVAPDRATLCRCGLSKNKPWCDGRHRGRKDFR